MHFYFIMAKFDHVFVVQFDHNIVIQRGLTIYGNSINFDHVFA